MREEFGTRHLMRFVGKFVIGQLVVGNVFLDPCRLVTFGDASSRDESRLLPSILVKSVDLKNWK
ncbi:hypothetical protein DLM45_02780 [Hyphomicrobium methylovorum]|nr:hypothetical protein [Hyphomicrobium methylovorum]